MARAIALAVSIPLPLSFVTSNIHDPPFSLGSCAQLARASRLKRCSRCDQFAGNVCRDPTFLLERLSRLATRPPQKFAARISDPPGGRVNLTRDGERLASAERAGGPIPSSYPIFTDANNRTTSFEDPGPHCPITNAVHPGLRDGGSFPFWYGGERQLGRGRPRKW